MPELTDFLGGTDPGRSTAVDSQQTMNFYPEFRGETAKSGIILIGTPGLRPFANIVTNGPCRGFFTSGGDRLFAVIGDKFLEILIDGTSTLYGTLTTRFGAVTFAENVNLSSNTNQIILIDGTNGYVFALSTNTFTQISDADYSAGTHVIYKDGFFIQNVSGTNTFIFSDLYDGLSWDAANFYAAEANADNVDAIGKINNEIWVFGGKSVEIWYSTGDSNDPFARVNNAFIDIGIKAKNSVATINNTIFWLGANSQGSNIVWMSNSYAPQRISTHSIEYLIGKMPFTDDAIGYCYQQEGHYFYVLSFQSGNKTIVYDMSTGLWHERGYYNVSTGDNDRHPGICHSFWSGKNMVGDYRNGKIYYYDLDYFTDDGNIIKRWRTGPHYHKDRRRLFFKEFEIDLERGVGNNNYQDIAIEPVFIGGEIIEDGNGGINEDTKGTNVIQ